MEKLRAYSNTLQDFAILMIIFLLTFQKFEPQFGTGLDNSYVWALNWLLVNDYSSLINLIYPIGPLGFLKMPTTEGYNLLIAIVFYSIVKIGFIILLLKLDHSTNGKRTFSSVLLIFIIMYFANIDLLLMGSSLILSFLSIKRQSVVLFVLASVVAFIGLFIKSSIGISSLSIVLLTPIIYYFIYREKVILIKQIVFFFIVAISLGLIVFNSPYLFFQYLIGIIKLSGSYSETLALFPNNNWVVLTGFLIITLAFPFLNKEKDARLMYLLLLFPLFAAWKHSMSRQDISHYSILFGFIFVFWGIIILVSSSKNKNLLLILPVSIMLLYVNMANLPMYSSRKVEISGINNFLEPLLDTKRFDKRYTKLSENAISKNRLNAETKKIIGSSTIDVYPWELSYVAANSFTWKPRKTLEIGASTSQWVSAKAAQSYLGNDDSPEYVLFHLIKNKYQGWFGSLDGRYILNDEPLLIYNLLNNYSIVEKQEKFLLYEKNESRNLTEPELEETQITKFGEWIEIPNYDDEIIRLKVKSYKTLAGHLKNFLYKGEEYLIDYLFEDGKILTFRYIPATAVDGLWCSPFIQNPFSDIVERDVVKIRLRNSSTLFVSKSIKVAFERIKIKSTDKYSPETDNANALFLKHIKNNDQTILNVNVNFDSLNSAQNKKYSLVVNHAFSGNKSHKIKGGKLSYSFKYPMDSLWALVNDSISNLEIQSDLKYLNQKSKTILVISLTTEHEKFWFSRSLANTKNEDKWEYLFFNKTFIREKHGKGLLKIYVWNNGTENVFIDDFRVLVIAKN